MKLSINIDTKEIRLFENTSLKEILMYLEEINLSIDDVTVIPCRTIEYFQEVKKPTITEKEVHNNFWNWIDKIINKKIINL